MDTFRLCQVRLGRVSLPCTNILYITIFYGLDNFFFHFRSIFHIFYVMIYKNLNNFKYFVVYWGKKLKFFFSLDLGNFFWGVQSKKCIRNRSYFSCVVVWCVSLSFNLYKRTVKIRNSNVREEKRKEQSSQQAAHSAAQCSTAQCSGVVVCWVS